MNQRTDPTDSANMTSEEGLAEVASILVEGVRDGCFANPARPILAFSASPVPAGGDAGCPSGEMAQRRYVAVVGSLVRW